MEDKKITDVKKLLSILDSVEQNSPNKESLNFGNYKEADIRDSIFDLLYSSQLFGEIKREDINDWTLLELRGALKILTEATLSNMPKEDALVAGKELAEKHRERTKNAKAQVAQTIKQAEDIAKKQKTVKSQASTQPKKVTPKIEVKSETEVFATPTEPLKTVDVPAPLQTKIAEVQTDPNFANKFTDFFSKAENTPEGIDTKTAQVVAVSLAADLALNKTPLIKIQDGKAVPLPNSLAAQIALLENGNVLENSFGTDKDSALKVLAQATATDGIWYMVQRQMVDKYFQTEDTKTASTLFLGKPDQKFEISDQKSNRSFPIDIKSSLARAQYISDLYLQDPSQVSTTVLRALNDITFRPDIGEFSRNISNLTRGFVDLFGKPGGAEAPLPSVNTTAALNYFKLLPQMSPELSALMFDQVRLATITFGKLPFAAAGGEIGINAGLLNGFSISVARFGATAATEAGLASAGAAAAGAGAAEGGAAVAAGTAAGGPIGAAIVALGAVIVTNFSKIKVWWQRNKGKIADVLLGFGLVSLAGGLLTGSVPLAVGGGLASGVGALSGGSLAGGVGSLWKSLSAIFTGAILPGIVGPLIGTLIGFPIVVIIILFIINAGAYVVPQGTSPQGVGGGGPSNIVPSACPVNGGVIGDGSYHPGNEQSGHGSNDYWRRMGGTCLWSLPQTTGCLGPTNGGNVCSSQAKTCDFYGFAMDVFPTGDIGVYAPLMEGNVVQWKYNGIHFLNGGGKEGESWGFTDTTGQYSIVLTHITGALVDQNRVYTSGEKIDEMYPQKTASGGNNTHVHIELQDKGIYQQPENYFTCDGSISPPIESPGPNGVTGNESL